MNLVSLDELSFSTFKELLNGRFRVEVAPATVAELELIEAEFIGEAAKDKATVPKHESFSLVFSGHANHRLTQRTYRFSHERIGAFELFIVPIAAEKGMIRYQAVFNRRLHSK